MGTLFKAKASLKQGRVQLMYQDTSSPHLLFMYFAFYMRFHQRLLRLTATIIPEFSTSDIESLQLEDFYSVEDGIWTVAKETHRKLGIEGFARLLTAE